MKIHTAKELLEHRDEKIPMLLDGVYPRTGLVALAGSSDCGKSSFLRQLAAYICLGKKKFVDFELNVQHNSVLYVTTEDDKNGVSSSLSRLTEAEEELINEEKLHFATEADSTNCINGIDDHLSKYPCDVVIIDSVSDLIKGDMNNQTVVRSFLEDYMKLAQKHDCLIIFLHHLRKSTKGEASKNDVSGSHAFEAKMRAVLMLKMPSGYHSQNRELKIAKGNYVSSEDKKKTINLNFDEKTLTFTSIGISTILSEAEKEEREEKIINKCLELHEEGSTLREIASSLTEMGLDVGRTKVGKIINEHKGE